MSNPPIFNIALLAEHSIGKSSFLNALVGNVVAPTSIQRETANIDVYQIREDVPYANVHKLVETVETRHKTNIENRKKKNLKLEELVEPNILVPPIKILGSKINANIFDFPGLNDAIDKDNLYLKIFKQNAPIIDYVIYLVDAKKPLTNTCEIQQLKEIWGYINDLKNDGIFIDLSIVVNKFDSKDDEDYLELFEDMKHVVQNELIGNKSNGAKIDVYRFCSHKFFVHNLKNRVKRIRIPKFYSKELQNIFTTARVNITRDMKRSLMQNLPIECDSIEIMEDLSFFGDDEDCNTDSPKRKSTKEPEVGDWDGLINQLHEYNQKFLPNRTKSIQGYIRDVCTHMISNPNMETVYKYLSSMNRYQIDYSTNRVDSHPDNLITSICKVLYSSSNQTNVLVPISGTAFKLLDILTSFFVQIYSENEIFVDYLEKYMFNTTVEHNLSRETYAFCLCKLLETRDMTDLYPEIITYIQTNTMFSHRGVPNILICPDLCTEHQDKIFVEKCKIVPVEKCQTIRLDSESFLIHEILNNAKIKQNNYELYCVILLLSVPRIILKRAYSRGCETLDLIDKYLGMDTRSYIELVINSSETRPDTEILGESVLSSKNFLQSYPNLYQHTPLCLQMELM